MNLFDIALAKKLGGPKITITQLNATQNQTYTAQEGEAYNPVVVNVPQTTVESLSVTTNGTYTASSGYAYSPVIVSVAAQSSEVEDFIMRTISGSYTNANVSVIGIGAFMSCISITSVNFPECVTMSFSAFQGCINLEAISFPKCDQISHWAFSGCSKLTEANFPECLSTGTAVFSSCTKLATISFPKCKSIIGQLHFQKCFNLLSAYFLGNSVPVLSNSNTFSSTPMAGYTTSTGGVYGCIFVKASKLSAFQSATNWAYFSSRMVGLTDAEIEALG